MFDCPVCSPPDAPRPSGTQTYRYNGITHKTAECAALASVGEIPIRTETGYEAFSGNLVCLECFPDGKQHTYLEGEDPHPRGLFERPPRGPDIGKRKPRNG